MELSITLRQSRINRFLTLDLSLQARNLKQTRLPPPKAVLHGN
jgi:hypothetical protein